jgi:hypothetical protein
MRYFLIGILLLCATVTSAFAQISVSIGINVPQYPHLVRVPGYPVYYAPQVDSNFFFYDGVYWVYQDDNWYESDWYNGPWDLVGPDSVPLFVLRIPVRYYRAPPTYFIDWHREQPPRWGDHWGRDWEQRRSGWDHWNHRAAPAPAPLPVYQRQYGGDRYPSQVEQQQALRNKNYRYQPRAPEVRQRHEAQQTSGGQAPVRPQQAKDVSQQDRSHQPQSSQRPNPPPSLPPAARRSEPPTAPPAAPPKADKGVEHAAPRQAAPAQPAQQRAPGGDQRSRAPQGSAPHEQRAAEPRAKESPPTDARPRQEPNRGQGQGPAPDHNRGDDRGR